MGRHKNSTLSNLYEERAKLEKEGTKLAIKLNLLFETYRRLSDQGLERAEDVYQKWLEADFELQHNDKLLQAIKVKIAKYEDDL